MSSLLLQSATLSLWNAGTWRRVCYSPVTPHCSFSKQRGCHGRSDVTSPGANQDSQQPQFDCEYANLSSSKRPKKHSVLNGWKLDSDFQKNYFKRNISTLKIPNMPRFHSDVNRVFLLLWPPIPGVRCSHDVVDRIKTGRWSAAPQKKLKLIGDTRAWRRRNSCDSWAPSWCIPISGFLFPCPAARKVCKYVHL